MTPDHLAAEGIPYAERVEYEERILAAEMEAVRLKREFDATLARLDRVTEVLVKARDALNNYVEVGYLGNDRNSEVARTLANELDRVLGGQVGEEG